MDRINFPYKEKQRENALKSGSINYAIKTVNLNNPKLKKKTNK